MKYFNKLQGFERSATGHEWELWKRLPIIFAEGTILPLLASACVYYFDDHTLTTSVKRETVLFFYVMLGTVMAHWTLVLTVAIGCAVVLIMKGPAYVADPYYMESPTNN